MSTAVLTTSWARRQYDYVPWATGGPRWHLIVESTNGALTAACKRALAPPFELVTEIPARLRCQKCERHVPSDQLADVR